MPDQTPSKQLLHPVSGGKPARIGDVGFKDPNKPDIVGIFPGYATAWKGRARQTVDDAPERAR
jgi:hypothetical protein